MFENGGILTQHNLYFQIINIYIGARNAQRGSAPQRGIRSRRAGEEDAIIEHIGYYNGEY